MRTSFLTRIPILRGLVDERFLDHRRRAAAKAGILGGVLAITLWYIDFIFLHTCDWFLLAVAVVILATKMGLFAWYRLHD